jgi:hypothetical protein
MEPNKRITHEQYMKKMSEPTKPDMVNEPPHYLQGDIECIDAIEAALGPAGFRAFCRGNIMKYNWRAEHKNGVKDIEKARWYINKLIDKMRTKAEHLFPLEEEERTP